MLLIRFSPFKLIKYILFFIAMIIPSNSARFCIIKFRKKPSHKWICILDIVFFHRLMFSARNPSNYRLKLVNWFSQLRFLIVKIHILYGKRMNLTLKIRSLCQILSICIFLPEILLRVILNQIYVFWLLGKYTNYYNWIIRFDWNSLFTVFWASFMLKWMFARNSWENQFIRAIQN